MSGERKIVGAIISSLKDSNFRPCTAHFDSNWAGGRISLPGCKPIVVHDKTTGISSVVGVVLAEASAPTRETHKLTYVSFQDGNPIPVED